MKCFYHLQADAVGICAQCTRAACRQCIEDIGGLLLCVGCLSLRQHQAELEEQATELNRQGLIQRARKRICWSWIIGGLGLVIGIFTGIAQASEEMRTHDLGDSWIIAIPLIVVLHIVLGGYLFWSMFWGTPVVWGWTKSFVKNFEMPTLNVNWVIWLVLLSCCISLPFSVAVYYSVFGGGIYQFFKCRRIARGTT
jgi:hypothetical protein